ncbi:MAG: ABC transporter substrate-binding protein/permease [Deltaproteobacteria bacterium]|nr:ABC transporter substrate-binding protein/permease [Deltaproteobacteria bacterium]
MRRVFSLLIALGALAPAQLAAQDRSWQTVQQRGELRFGLDVQGGEPYASEDAQGRLVGFEIEIAKALGQTLGVRMVPVQNDWSALVPALMRGDFDIILNGFEATPEHAARVRLSRPYYVFAERLTARANATWTYTNLSSLRGLRLGALGNSQAWLMLRQAGLDPVPYEGVQEPYTDLAAGRVDAVLMDDIIADRYGQAPGLRRVADVATGTYAIGVRPGDDTLLTAINRGLDTLLREGHINVILARWHLGGTRQTTLVTMHAQSEPAASPKHALSRGQIILFFKGALVTLLLACAAMALAVVLGLALAIARRPWAWPLSGVVRRLASAYVEVFRGTPVLLQLYLLYYGLPQVAPWLTLPAAAAAILGLGMNYAAYEAEIYRAGIEAVPRGQWEAALSLGMSQAQAFRRAVLPQALRISLPGMANDFIALLKDTSLVSVITVVELTKRLSITAVDTSGWLVPGLFCAALYFAMSYPLSLLARRLEAGLAKQ